jgi:hypothetical protein
VYVEKRRGEEERERERMRDVARRAKAWENKENLSVYVVRTTRGERREREITADFV